MELALREVFWHQDPDDGRVRCFDVTAMADAAHEVWDRWTMDTMAEAVPVSSVPDGVELLVASMDPAFVRFVQESRGIEPARLDRICEPYLSRAVFGVLLPDGTTLMVDGHHRLVRWFEAGHKEYPMLRWDEGSWESFVLGGS